MRALRFALLAAALAAPSVLALACGGDPPEPGFEEVGGSGEGASGPSTSSSKASSTASGPSTTSTMSGPTTTSTTTTTTSTTTSTGSSGCNDLGPGEPNDSEASAHDLGTIGDCDDEGGTVSGLLDGTTDPDWYTYYATDGAGCTTDPNRTVTSSHPIRVCKFIQCDDNEENDFECPGGTSAATSPDGRPGCCGSSAFEFSLTCGSSSINSDNATVYIRIDTQENACVTYTLSYAY